MAKVFLGGTVNGSSWREQVIPRLNIDYFNPIVPKWTEEAYQRELHERETSDFCLYVLTPKMQGIYSVAEAVDDSNKRPARTLFCYLSSDGDQQFTKHQLDAMKATARMIERNGGKTFTSLDEVVHFLNQEKS